MSISLGLFRYVYFSVSVSVSVLLSASPSLFPFRARFPCPSASLCLPSLCFISNAWTSRSVSAGRQKVACEFGITRKVCASFPMSAQVKTRASASRRRQCSLCVSVNHTARVRHCVLHRESALHTVTRSLIEFAVAVRLLTLIVFYVSTDHTSGWQFKMDVKWTSPKSMWIVEQRVSKAHR